MILTSSENTLVNGRSMGMMFAFEVLGHKGIIVLPGKRHLGKSVLEELMAKNLVRAAKQGAFVVFLGAAYACGSGDKGVAPVQPGKLRVSVTTTGSHLDVDGYTLLLNGTPLALFTSNDIAILSRITPKTYTVQLGGIAPNCHLDAAANGTVQVKSRTITELDFRITCDQTERIAFVSERDGNPQIYVMEVDGSGQARVTFDFNDNMDPTWSPDGNRIAFGSFTEGVGQRIVVANVDRSAVETVGDDSNARSSYPAWSPDGTQIAFVSARSGNSEIYIMNADGTNVRQLTSSADLKLRPSWSPDQSTIVFDAGRASPAPLFSIWLVGTDGSGSRQLTTRTPIKFNAHFSPDGTKILYQSEVAQNLEVFVMNSDGTGHVQLTESPADDKDPVWSKDGTRIVFASNRSGDFDIYVMNADGTNVSRLTNSPGDDFDPVWSR